MAFRLLGYADLGAREGRNVLVSKAREFCKYNSLPLLAFPEGAMTNGQKGLLKFSSWPFEVKKFFALVITHFFVTANSFSGYLST